MFSEKVRKYLNEGYSLGDDKESFDVWDEEIKEKVKNLYVKNKDGLYPNILYVDNKRVDIDNSGNASVWKDGKLIGSFNLKESTKTQDFINDVSADEAALRFAGISGDTMTLDQYQKYQEYLHNIKKNDTSRYDITISYWDRNGYPQEKSYVGRSLKEIAKKFVNAKDKVYDYRELSDYSDNLYELVRNSTCSDIDDYLEKIANGENPESLVDLD